MRRYGALPELASGAILIGQENGYLSEFDPETRRFKHYRPPGFRDQTVLCMFPENDSIIWVGLYKHGIARWNRRSGEVTNYPQITEFIHRNTSVSGIIPYNDPLPLAGYQQRRRDQVQQALRES